MCYAPHSVQRADIIGLECWLTFAFSVAAVSPRYRVRAAWQKHRLSEAIKRRLVDYLGEISFRFNHRHEDLRLLITRRLQQTSLAQVSKT
jgi:hypothetical protein